MHILCHPSCFLMNDHLGQCKEAISGFIATACCFHLGYHTRIVSNETNNIMFLAMKVVTLMFNDFKGLVQQTCFLTNRPNLNVLFTEMVR